MEDKNKTCNNLFRALKNENNEKKLNYNYIPQKNIINNPNSISKKDMEYLNIQMEKCICKIFYDAKFGTGFFCNIPFPNDSNLLPVLITSNDIIGENEIISGKAITLKIDDESYSYEIIINNSRLIFTNKDYDITIIELKKEDNLNIYAIEIDYDFLNSLDINDTNSIYLLFYSKTIYSENSFGVIKSISEDKYKINYTYLQDKKSAPLIPSSGCPILNLNNFKVIGIHKSKQNNKNYNIGSIIRWPIEEFNKQFKNVFEIKKKSNDFYILDIIKVYEKKGEYKEEYEEEISKDTILLFQLDYDHQIALKCPQDTPFSFIEKCLYDKLPQFYNKNNIFIIGEKEIDHNKTIGENNCGDGIPITIKNIENREQIHLNKNKNKIFCYNENQSYDEYLNYDEHISDDEN